MTCVGYYERGTLEADAWNRELWERAGRPGPDPAAEAVPEMSELLVDFDAVRKFAKALLEKKWARSYCVPTVLVIDAFMGHVPLTPAEEGPVIAAALRVPDGCGFERIYLRMSRNFARDIELFPIR